MELEGDQPSSTATPGPLALAALMGLLGPLGTGMVMQGLGSNAMDFLHPNPDIPRFVFLLLGVFVLACTALVLAQLVRLPHAAVTTAGMLTIVTGLAVFNWMVFDGGGHAACFIGPVPSFVLGSYGTALCGFVIKAGVVVIDGIAVLCAVALLQRRTAA